MKNIQDIFLRIQERKHEQRELKAMYRDALLSSAEYTKVVEDIKDLKVKKKQIEENIQSDFRGEFSKLDQIKIENEEDSMMLSDIALNHITKGEPVEVTDAKQNKYEPLFSVRFKKI